MASAVQEDLRSSEKKALIELRHKLQEAIASNQLLHPPHPEKNKTRVANSSFSPEETPTGVSLWGVPLLPSKNHEGTDVILLKFLRAREFKPLEALEMIQRTLKWRREYGVEPVCGEEELASSDFHGSAYMSGVDRCGQPVCYNVYGVFRERGLYQKAFGTEEKRERFMRWRIQFMEKGIEQLSFRQGGGGSLVQVIDLKGAMNSSMKDLRSTMKKVVAIFQDNYPEFVAKHIFINVSFRYYAYHAMFSNFFTERTRSKFILARPSRVTETLLKFIAPENIPIQYGGLKREDDDEFSVENGASELAVRGAEIATIAFPIIEPGVTVVWDIAVVGWDVYYKEEFIPDDECSYRILIQKERKLDEPVRNSFYINEPGKVVLTIDNRTFKKKRVLHRSKSKPTIPLYNLLNQPIM